MSTLTIFMPVYDKEQPVREVLQAFANQTHGDFQLVIGDFSNRLTADELTLCPQATLAELALDTRSKTFNRVIENFPGRFFMPIPPYIIPELTFVEKIIQAFANPQIAMVYADYFLVEDNKSNIVKLYDWEGQIEERFDFGFVKAYDLERMKEIKNYDESLEVMEEYDLWLKLTDCYQIGHIVSPVYRALKAQSTAVDDDISKKLFSPGGKGLGQFSYLFYPEKMEEEVKAIFVKKLKRINAYIDHPTVEVKYPAKPYAYLASVVIPIFNRVKYIKNAVEKVLSGTWQDFEVIIVDNGSTDGTQDEVRRIADPRVRLIQNNGRCIADALNCGIRQAKGKYICQLDSDDEYTPETLKAMIDQMENNPKCGLAISYDELMVVKETPLPELGIIKHLGDDRNNIIRVDGAGALRVFSKVVLEEFGLYDEINFGNFGEDYDMVLKVGEKYDVDRVHQVLYRYRRHSDNTDVTRDPIMKVRNKLKSRLNALQRRQQMNLN